MAICSHTDLIKGKIRTGERVQDLIMGCISYLDTRTAFWQQQKPIHARQRDRKLMQQQWNRVRHKPPSDPARYVLTSLEDIDKGEPLQSLRGVKVPSIRFLTRKFSISSILMLHMQNHKLLSKLGVSKIFLNVF